MSMSINHFNLKWYANWHQSNKPKTVIQMMWPTNIRLKNLPSRDDKKARCTMHLCTKLGLHSLYNLLAKLALETERTRICMALVVFKGILPFFTRYFLVFQILSFLFWCSWKDSWFIGLSQIRFSESNMTDTDVNILLK